MKLIHKSKAPLQHKGALYHSFFFKFLLFFIHCFNNLNKILLRNFAVFHDTEINEFVFYCAVLNYAASYYTIYFGFFVSFFFGWDYHKLLSDANVFCWSCRTKYLQQQQT